MKTIYIVDDNEMMRAFLHSYFEKNYEIVCCESGEEALATMRNEKTPDLMLLDYQLEGISGYETLRNLKSSGFYKHIPVVFLSGQNQSQKRIDCLRSGATDFINKPFNPQELEVKVNNILSTQN